MRNIAIILAGGSGARLGYDLPKQFIKIAGKMIIEHTIDVFQSHPKIDEIFIICNKDYIFFYEDLVNVNHYDKVIKLLVGGEKRSDSSLAALNALNGEIVNLIFHDAVRPLVNNRIIDECIFALETYNAVDVAIPATDTIIEVQNNFIKNIPDRSCLYRGQTPQAFKSDIIRKAYDKAMQDKFFKATDDCGVVKKYLPDEKIYIVKGEEFNLKLTFEEDLFLIEKLFQVKSIQLSEREINLKEQLKDQVVVIFGGSYGIGKDIVEICKKNEAKVYSFSRTENKTDISNVDDVRRALKKVNKIEGRINYIVNTAGVLHKQSIINMSYEKILEAININYLGNIIISKEAFIYLQKTEGSLLFFTSSSYTRGRAMYSTYSSLKAATVNFVQALSSEWEDFHIRINCINPERTLTPMRINNFGNEDPSTLLNAKDVAEVSIKTMISNISGQVIDVKKKLK